MERRHVLHPSKQKGDWAKRVWCEPGFLTASRNRVAKPGWFPKHSMPATRLLYTPNQQTPAYFPPSAERRFSLSGEKKLKTFLPGVLTEPFTENHHPSNFLARVLHPVSKHSQEGQADILHDWPKELRLPLGVCACVCKCVCVCVPAHDHVCVYLLL